MDYVTFSNMSVWHLNTWNICAQKSARMHLLVLFTCSQGTTEKTVLKTFRNSPKRMWNFVLISPKHAPYIKTKFHNAFSQCTLNLFNFSF